MSRHHPYAEGTQGTSTTLTSVINFTVVLQLLLFWIRQVDFLPFLRFLQELYATEILRNPKKKKYFGFCIPGISGHSIF
jgi:hypothetical protein